MKPHPILNILAVAITTATFTILVSGTGPMEAGSEASPAAKKVATPKLVASGVECTLTTSAGSTLGAGDEPVFELKAINTTDKPASLQLALVMTSTAPGSELSRMPMIPSQLWQQQPQLTLQPKETKTVRLTTGTKLPPGKSIAVSMGELPGGKKTVAPAIIALNFGTALPVQAVSAK